VNIYLEAEKELAIALGYTNFQRWEANGMPVSGHIDGFVTPLKQWTRDSAAAFDLMVEYEINVSLHHKFVWADEICVAKSFCDFDEAQTMRYAIVKAVIAKLKGE
jgi:hypothetical protein